MTSSNSTATHSGNSLRPGVLAGKRVLELGRVLAAPYAGQILGDLGAEVIKFERPEKGDDSRHYAPVYMPAIPGAAGMAGQRGDAAHFISVNRNKKSITLNIADPRGQDVVRRLAADADVLIENYKTGDLARYGLGYEQLSGLNPRLVYCSLTGYGQEGPYADRAGFDPIFQAMCGFMSVTGIEDGKPGAGPLRAGINIIDIIAGWNAAMAIVAALYERDTRSSKGQFLDIALLDAGVAMMSHSAQQYLVNGKSPRRSATMGLKTGVSGILHCEDADVNVNAGRDHFFAALCKLFGREEFIDDPRFKTQALRGGENNEWLLAEFNKTAPQRRALDVVNALNEAGVPAGVVNNMQQCFADPQVQARQLAVPLAHPAKPDLQVLASPMRFSATPVTYRSPPPLLGEHTEELLAGLGLDAAAIEGLRRDKVI
jgi:crotonobetainyl-CoA:carnitine CoA-transferase CaiB-like acyl-CoA transferase